MNQDGKESASSLQEPVKKKGDVNRKSIPEQVKKKGGVVNRKSIPMACIRLPRHYLYSGLPLDRQLHAGDIVVYKPATLLRTANRWGVTETSIISSIEVSNGMTFIGILGYNAVYGEPQDYIKRLGFFLEGKVWMLEKPDDCHVEDMTLFSGKLEAPYFNSLQLVAKRVQEAHKEFGDMLKKS